MSFVGSEAGKKAGEKAERVVEDASGAVKQATGMVKDKAKDVMSGVSSPTPAVAGL